MGGRTIQLGEELSGMASSGRLGRYLRTSVGAVVWPSQNGGSQSARPVSKRSGSNTKVSRNPSTMTDVPNNLVQPTIPRRLWAQRPCSFGAM